MPDDLKLLDLTDLDSGAGRRLLEATVAMGFHPSVARRGLRAELDAWTADGAIEGVLAELSGSADLARRPGTVLIIAARTLPASTMRAVLMARLLGARVILKPARGQLPVGEALAAADDRVEVLGAPSTDAAALDAAIGRADSVMVLGGDATVEAVRRRTRPGQPFVGYGHRSSVAWLEDDTARSLEGLAEDLCAWDHAGCLSPQVAWTRSPPERLLPRLGEAVRRIEDDLPMSLPPEAARERVAARTLAEMTGAALETRTAALLALPASRFRPSPGWRCLWVLPADPDSLAEISGHLSTIGYGGPAERSPRIGSVRVCRLGRMQRPPLDWPHDGLPNLRGLLLPAPG